MKTCLPLTTLIDEVNKTLPESSEEGMVMEVLVRAHIQRNAAAVSDSKAGDQGYHLALRLQQAPP